MGLFDRWRRPRPIEFPALAPRPLAVPMLPEQVRLLSQCMENHQERTSTVLYTPPLNWREDAIELVRRVALASELGHTTVPMPVLELPRRDTLAHDLRQANLSAQARQLNELGFRFEALAVVASRRGWEYRIDAEARTYRWAEPVAADAAASVVVRDESVDVLRQIERGGS